MFRGLSHLDFSEAFKHLRDVVLCLSPHFRERRQFGQVFDRMIYSNEHKLKLPGTFPDSEMAAFMAKARSVLLVPEKSDAWKEFAGASNLIAWRFRGCHEDMTRYIDSWNRHGANVDFEEIYLRDRALFGMFSSGISCLESTCYALAALASHANVLGIPFGKDEQRACNPSWLRRVVETQNEARPLAAALGKLTGSVEWKDWIDLRNRMTHRSNLPRIVEATIGAPPPPAKALHFAATSSTPYIADDVSRFVSLFGWLANSVRELVVAGERLPNRL